MSDEEPSSRTLSRDKKAMNRTVILFLISLGLAVRQPQAKAQAPLKLVQTIQVPQVTCENPDLHGQELVQAVNTYFMPRMTCHFDRFGLDLKGGRLFVVAENNKTVEVYAISSGKLLHTIGGFGMPHNVICRPDVNRIYITDGSTTEGSLRIFDGTTYELIKTVKLLPDADSMGYDPVTHYLYITNGGRFGSLDYTLLSIVNSDIDEHIGDIKTNFTRLEHMVMENAGPRIFLNITDRREMAVIDRNKRAIVATWPVTEGQFNVASDLDEADHRLFVACRSGMLDVFDTETGKVIAVLPIAKGVDDVVYDPVRRRVYVPCAQGLLDVYEQRDPDHYTLIAEVTTGLMGKNCILVSSLNRLYVGVPKYGNVEAKILVYTVQ
jgi:DNA-binding beta-propeller fold protein YncE